MCHCFLDLFLNLLANLGGEHRSSYRKKGDLLRDGKAITRFGLDWLAEKRSRINISLSKQKLENSRNGKRW